MVTFKGVLYWKSNLRINHQELQIKTTIISYFLKQLIFIYIWCSRPDKCCFRIGTKILRSGFVTKRNKSACTDACSLNFILDLFVLIGRCLCWSVIHQSLKACLSWSRRYINLNSYSHLLFCLKAVLEKVCISRALYYPIKPRYVRDTCTSSNSSTK